MKTKEQIIEQEFHNHTASNLADFEIKFMKNSMESWAKQQSIEFAKWVQERYYYEKANGFYYEIPAKAKYGTSPSNLSEVYTQFTEHQTLKENNQ